MKPNDFGPIYAETVMDRFPVEPWNTFSNAVFILVLIYLARRTRFNFKRYPLHVISIPILFIGFVGGTVFHATRSHSLWLIMDFVPIMLLSIMASIYLWLQVTTNKWWALLGIVLPIAASRLLKIALPWPRGVAISIGYTGLALSLLIPALLLCKRNGWLGKWELLGSALTFAIAITFRMIDSGIGAQLLPMGTHFLWHIFGGVSVFLLFRLVLLHVDNRTSASSEVI